MTIESRGGYMEILGQFVNKVFVLSESLSIFEVFHLQLRRVIESLHISSEVIDTVNL